MSVMRSTTLNGWCPSMLLAYRGSEPASRDCIHILEHAIDGKHTCAAILHEARFSTPNNGVRTWPPAAWSCPSLAARWMVDTLVVRFV